MKKIILALVSVFTIGLSAYSYVDNQFMTTSQYLQNVGYSAEMSRMMAITNLDPYREPYVERNTFKNILKRSYNYISPDTFTDINFYNHNINMNSTSWKDL